MVFNLSITSPYTAVYVAGMTGKEVEATEESIQTALDAWISEDPDSRWAAFNVFDIV